METAIRRGPVPWVIRHNDLSYVSGRLVLINRAYVPDREIDVTVQRHQYNVLMPEADTSNFEFFSFSSIVLELASQPTENDGPEPTK